MINKTADRLVRGTAADGSIRCLAAVTTNLVSEAASRHQVTATVAAALGRTLTGTLLLASGLKDLDRLTVQITGDGPVGGIICEANSSGQVRGYVRNPEADAPLNAKGKFDVRSIVGEGMLYVTREFGYDVGLYPEPYRGSVPLVSGEIGEDFAYYLLKSEQIPSAVSLGVLLQAEEDGTAYVAAAGGIMIQLMPGAGESIVQRVERSVCDAPQTTTLIKQGATPVDLLRAALGEIEFTILNTEAVGFFCPCSYERAVSLVSSIERTELEEMLTEDKGAVMICHFCNATYRMGESELAGILNGG